MIVVAEGKGPPVPFPPLPEPEVALAETKVLVEPRVTVVPLLITPEDPTLVISPPLLPCDPLNTARSYDYHRAGVDGGRGLKVLKVPRRIPSTSCRPILPVGNGYCGCEARSVCSRITAKNRWRSDHGGAAATGDGCDRVGPGARSTILETCVCTSNNMQDGSVLSSGCNKNTAVGLLVELAG